MLNMSRRVYGRGPGAVTNRRRARNRSSAPPTSAPQLDPIARAHVDRAAVKLLAEATDAAAKAVAAQLGPITRYAVSVDQSRLTAELLASDQKLIDRLIADPRFLEGVATFLQPAMLRRAQEDEPS